MTPLSVSLWLWAAFLVAWWAPALFADRGTARVKRTELFGWFVGWFVGFGLLFATEWARHIAAAQPVARELWSNPAAVAWLLVAAQVGAFTFAFWARVHMGRLWSGGMHLMTEHRVVDTGPYRLVRHPIYTAFIAAAWGFALTSPTPLRLGGALVLTLTMVLKSRAEEALLRRELGAESYDAYAARTPALIPFGPR